MYCSSALPDGKCLFLGAAAAGILLSENSCHSYDLVPSVRVSVVSPGTFWRAEEAC